MRRPLWLVEAGGLPRFSQSLLIGLLCALLIKLTIEIGLLQGLEQRTLDVMFRARGIRFPDSQIVLVVADDATVARFGRWPLPRSVYARAVRQLSAARVRTIGLNVLLSARSADDREDADLARACAESGRVVQASAFLDNSGGYAGQPASAPGNALLARGRFSINNQRARTHHAVAVTAALPMFQASAAGVGHINIYPEADGAFRRIPHLVSYAKATYPSLSLAVAAHYLGLQPTQVVARGDTLRVGQTLLPLDADGETWINWVGGNKSFPTISMNELFDGQVQPSQIRDRVVLIGVNAAGGFDFHASPFSPLQPSLELEANALDNILSQRPLRQAVDLAQLALLFGFAILCGLLTVRGRAVGSMVWLGVLSFLLWRVAIFLLAGKDLYVPVAAPLLAGALTFAACTLMNYREEWEANRRADTAVAALARGGALTASGRDREQLVAVIQQTTREALQAREVYLVASPVAWQALNDAASRVAQAGRVVLWPGNSATTRTLGATPPIAASGDLAASLSQLAAGVISAPGSSHPDLQPGARTVAATPLPGSSAGGVLLAVGRRDGRVFTGRDALLLETLAKQASLALENLQIYEQLQGRVESANLELGEAYRLMTEQSTKLVAAVESIDEALIVTDEDCRAVFTNGATVRLLPPSGLQLGDRVPDSLRRLGLAEVANLFQRPEITAEKNVGLKQEVNHEATAEAGNVVRRTLTAQLTPLVGPDGRSLGAMLVLANITAQRELDQMKSDFVSYVAHELRTPLTNILGYASLLNHSIGRLSDSEKGDMTSAIIRHCRRLNRMITELLDISRLEAGHALALNLAPLDLAALCERILTDQRASLPGNAEYTLDLECPNRPFMVSADADRMEQIILNLVSNAIKYSPEGGVVTISLEGGGPAPSVLSVHDNGMGMSEEQVSQLFSKYYRTPQAVAAGIKGTGLGLFLIKQLVEAHGGTMEVSSAPGEGSTFRVVLPPTVPAAANGHAEMPALTHSPAA